MSLKIHNFDATRIGAYQGEVCDWGTNGIHVHDKNALIFFDVDVLETIHLENTLMLG